MSTSRGARVTLFGQWVKLATQLAGIVVLARLLTPEAFGLVAMVAAVAAFATLLSDFGLSLAAVQVAELSDKQKSTLFWLNLAAGLLGAGVVAGSGPLLSAFYGQTELVLLAVGLAFPIIFASVGVQSRVELNRAGRFVAMAVIDASSSAVALLAAVASALMGLGVWALVVQQIVLAFSATIATSISARWWPGAPAPLREVASLVTFGMHNLAAQVMSLVSRTADVLSVGRVQGPFDLGNYTRASQLIALALQQMLTPLTRVLLPRLSRTSDQTHMNELLIRAQTITAYVTGLAFSLTAVVSPALVPLVLGPDWVTAGSLLRIFCVGAVFSGLGYVYYWAFLARAQTMTLTVAEAPGRIVMVVGALVTASIGMEWVAWSIVAGQMVIFVVSSVMAYRKGIDVSGILGASWRPLVISTSASVVGLLVSLGSADPLISTLLGAMGWVICASASLLMPAVRRDVIQLISSLRG